MKVKSYKKSHKQVKTNQPKLNDDGSVKTDTNGNIKYKYEDVLDSDQKRIYTHYLEVVYIPEEGETVPKMLSQSNLNALAKEFKANNPDKELMIKGSSYTLKRSNLFDSLPDEDGSVTTLLSAFYMPTYTPKPSSLSF